MRAVILLILALPLLATVICVRAPQRACGLVTAVTGVACLGLVVALVPAAAHRDLSYLGFLRADALSAVFLLATGFLYAAWRSTRSATWPRERQSRLCPVLAPVLDRVQPLRLVDAGRAADEQPGAAVDRHRGDHGHLRAAGGDRGHRRRRRGGVEVRADRLGRAGAGPAGHDLRLLRRRAGARAVLRPGVRPAAARGGAAAARRRCSWRSCSRCWAYGTKMGLFPVHTWLPDAHSEAPTPVSALLSGSLLAVSFYAILRFYQVSAAALGPRFPRDVLLVFGVASLLLAALYLFGQRDIKRLLAYSSVEHMGILAIGVSFGAPVALAGRAAARPGARRGERQRVHGRRGAGAQVRHQADLRRSAAAWTCCRGAGRCSCSPSSRWARCRRSGSSAASSRSSKAASPRPATSTAAILIIGVTVAFLGLVGHHHPDAVRAAPPARGLAAVRAPARPRPGRAGAGSGPGGGAGAGAATADGASGDPVSPAARPAPAIARGEPSAWMVVPVAAGAVALIVLGVHPPAELTGLLARAVHELRGSGPMTDCRGHRPGQRARPVGRAGRPGGRRPPVRRPVRHRRARTACCSPRTWPGPGWRHRHALLPPGSASYPALTPRLGAAFWYEREIHDLFGVVPQGHPRLEPLILVSSASPPRPGTGTQPDDAEPEPGVLPSHVAGPGLFTIPHGPVRSGVVESIEYLVETPGEDIPHLNMRVLYIFDSSTEVTLIPQGSVWRSMISCSFWLIVSRCASNSSSDACPSTLRKVVCAMSEVAFQKFSTFTTASIGSMTRK